MTGDSGFRLDGDASAPMALLLAHGAGAGMDSPFLAEVATGLAARGLFVVRFEFPYMALRHKGRRTGPDRLPRLLDHFGAIADRWRSRGPFAVGGKSMGGRIATMVADQLGARAAVVFGYPFHPPGNPGRVRTAHLATLRTPTLVLQGQRDPFGVPGEVAGYELSPRITVRWSTDGDHSLVPRKASGRTAAQNLAEAIDAAAGFLLGS